MIMSGDATTLDTLRPSSATMRPVTKVTVFGIRLAVVVLIAYWLVIFAGTHAPRIPHAVPLVNDKVMHFTAYFCLTLLMCYSTTSPRWLRRFTAIGLTAMVYGAIDEWTQAWVPNRQPDLADYLADVAGIGAALGSYVAAKFIYESILRSRFPRVGPTPEARR